MKLSVDHRDLERTFGTFLRDGCGNVLLSFAFLFLTCSAIAGNTTQDDYPTGSRIDWQPFEPVLFERAKAGNRHLFLYFHGQWCSWCLDFQDESLEQDDVVATLRAGYIPVLIDLDRRRDLFTRYGGRGLPFVVILDDRNEIRGRFTGHVESSDLVRMLTEGRRQISATGREFAASEPINSVGAFLDMLDEVYEPKARRLSGSAMFGSLSKRPQPWTLNFLLHQAGWRERMPGLLDQIIEDLADREEGGFFFFHDPDQADANRALETSKRLDLNAAFLWLFADAYRLLGEDRYRTVVEHSLSYLKTHLWDPDEQRFYTSQHSNAFYYAQSRAERTKLTPPVVDRTTYADTSGQVIAALVRASVALDDPDILEWARVALEGLDRQLRFGTGYRHALPPGGPAELEGYLPAHIWPGIAWTLYHHASGLAPGDRQLTLLRQVASYYDAKLNAYRERNKEALEPWSETRTQSALAWWLATLPPADIKAAGIDPERVHALLSIPSGADPDDVALGFWALEVQKAGQKRTEGKSINQQNKNH